MFKEAPLSHIKTVKALREFPDTVLDIEKPWDYRVSTGCLGIAVRPILWVSGNGAYLKELRAEQKEELRELLLILNDEKKWGELNELEKLDLRIRASRLLDQFSISKMTSFRR